MNISTINPYIRLATKSTLRYPLQIKNRVLFDYELLYVRDGKCNITINEEPYVYKKGDILLLTPGTEHRFDVLEGRPFSQPHIHFDMFYDKFSESRYINYKCFSEMNDSEKQMIQENIFKDTPLPKVIKTDPLVFEPLFFEIIRLYEEKNGAQTLMCKAKMCELLDLLFRDFMKPEPARRTFTTIDYVKDYIDMYYAGCITLDSLASQFHLDKYYLLRKFRDTYGTTIIHYVKLQKLNAAKKMLQEHFTVSEVSEKLGFDSIYTFSRFFKNMTGISPKQFSSSHPQKKESP